MPASFKPVVLMVLDGWGESRETKGNVILNANNLSTFIELDQYYPKTLLQASGISVGLPWLQYGNSEVGHQTLGTGQVTFQDLPRITNSIKNGSFFQNENILALIQQVKTNNSNLHLMGLCSDGGVHAHIDHMLAFLDVAKTNGVGNRTFIHAITDGRDTSPTSSKNYIKKILETKTGQIATLAGRFYTMDRNNNWDRVKKGYDAMFLGKGIQEKDPLTAINNQYSKSLTDEHIEPVVIVDNAGNPIGKIKQNDVMLFINYRKDRAKQITQAAIDPNFKHFPIIDPQSFKFATMIKYDNDFNCDVLFPPQEIKTKLSQIISQQGLRQLKIAETEKYAHVTYFFNGGDEKPYEKEDQILVPSKNVKGYDEVPAMSAPEVTERLLGEIDKKAHDFILVNFANPDMVGHTGEYEAGIQAIDTVNQYVKEVIIKVLENNGCLIITADHGNCEEMVNLKTGEKDTQHSNNPVPCWIVTPQNRRSVALTNKPRMGVQGMLVDVAPTVLSLLGLPTTGMVGMDLRRIAR